MCYGEFLYIRTLCDASHGLAWPPLRVILDITRSCESEILKFAIERHTRRLP